MNKKNQGLKICAMLGANMGIKQNYQEAVEQFAFCLIEGGHTLVYGGGRIGLMGVLADAVLRKGGRAIGITTPQLFEIEGHHRLSQTIFVNSIFERKQKMEEMSDGFVALPGGLGTLDELTDFWNLLKMGLITKPVGIFNVDHYYDVLFLLMQNMIDQGFLNRQHQNDLIFADDSKRLIHQMVERINQAEIMKYSNASNK